MDYNLLKVGNNFLTSLGCAELLAHFNVKQWQTNNERYVIKEQLMSLLNELSNIMYSKIKTNMG
jgi:hypothetical protein